MIERAALRFPQIMQDAAGRADCGIASRQSAAVQRKQIRK